MMNIEELAEKLHEWYLEATAPIYEDDAYNIHAQIPYKYLTEAQKSIDRYIAKKIIGEKL